MNITTKFNKGDTVWVMVNNRPKIDNIDTIEIKVSNEIYIKYTLKTDVIYYYEKDEKLFRTKENLLKSL